jgi:hypothetical protein
MAYLVAAVAIVGVLCLLDLLLTVGVVRRLREHTQLLAAAQRAEGDSLPVPGTPVGDFRTATTDGEAVSLSPDEETLVGVFSSDCEPCRVLLPEFADHAAGIAGGRPNVIAVIVDDGGETESMRAALAPVARVVVEGHGGAVSSAFRTSFFPSLYVVSGDGRLVVSGHDVDMIRRSPAGAST